MQSVDRIVQLIEILGTKQEGMPISQISKQLNLSGSTIHRLLVALKNHGIVHQDELNKRYYLGLRLLQWGGRLLDTNHVRNAAYSKIRDLSSKFKTCVFLSVLENGKIICIDTVANIAGNIHFYVKVGSLMPLNAAAASQAIVAFLPQPLIDDLIEHERIQSYTEKTICSVQKLKNRMEDVRENGYAICDGELDLGVIAISVPIFDFTNSVVASITMCDIKISDDFPDDRLNALKETARNISLSLGDSSTSLLDFY